MLACGGFQGNRNLLREYLGPGAENLKPISPGSGHNAGLGINMALALGAATTGDWGGMHCEPIDPRSNNSAPVVLIYPFGIVVDRMGRRFFDEGGGLVHETWEDFARAIHFQAPGRIAYAILDSRVHDISDWRRAVRSDVGPVEAGTVPGLAEQLGIASDALQSTINEFNACAPKAGGKFDASGQDGLATSGLDPPKSNWARPLDRPPYLAYPLICGIAYTFGGLSTDTRARVLSKNGPVSRLYAAGEITGHFYRRAPNAISILRSIVFGRIAGQTSVDDLCYGAGS